MTIPTKKLQNGFEMPVYGLGTWQMGGRETHDPNSDDEADIKAIQTAIELGITHIDTAEKYADGHTETIVGKALKNFDGSKYFLVSKVGGDHLRYNDVLAACKASLKRCQTDYFDLYLTHRMNPPNVSYEETMKAMDELVDEGLVKNIGFCNYTVDAIKEAQKYAKHELVAGQLHYNLQIREVERKGILEHCQNNDILLIAWRPVQKGALLQNPPQILQEMMQKYNKTASQIAINWLISQKNVVTLSKTTNTSHLKENLGALDFEMDKEDVEKLRTEFPNQQDFSDAVPLSV